MPKLLRAVRMEQCIACMGCMLTCARVRHNSLSVERSAIRVRTAGGFQSQMLADICMGCDPPPCASVCMGGALTPRKGGGVRFDREACFACRKCVEACPVNVIEFDEELHIPIICVQCGTCVRHCPHQCLTMEDVERFEDREGLPEISEMGGRKNAG
jgi:Fe-S-cluster-containing dehydrogenase component